MSDTLTFSGPISRDISRRTAAIARCVSDLLSPAVLGIPCLLLIVLASDVPGTYWFALQYFVVAIPLPVLYVLWLVKSGRVTDFHLPNRRDRTAPFLVTIACGLGAVLLLFYFQAPTTFLAPVLTALAQTILLFAITVFWQISIHAATTSGLVTFAILAMGPGASVLALLVPLVMWARVYLGRHTLTQTVVGACLGIVSFTTLFVLRGVVW